jgi:DHA3 family macrolide efflux protein-like MFS transporter
MRTLRVLRRRHIAVLWVGLCLSCMGDYFYLVAVMWTAAGAVGSAAGLVAASESVAALAFAPIAGLIVDRVDRRRAMMVADAGRAAAVAALGLFAAKGALGIAPLVAVALVLGVFDATFHPALYASVPALVGHPEELQATNGLIDATRRLARAIGPSLAGAVAAIVPLAHFFAIDAASFCASGVAVLLVGPRFRWKEEAPASIRGARGVARELREAWRLVAGHEAIAWSLVALFVTNLTWCAGFQVGGVLLASRVLGTGMAGYAFLVGAYGVGNVVGNVGVSNTLVKRRVFMVFLGKVVLGVGFLVIAIAPSLPVAMAGAAIAAVGGPMGELPLVAMLQTEFDARSRGRVFALYVMVQHAGVAMGLALAAPLFAWAPVRAGIVASAIVLATTGASGIARFGRRVS